MILDHKWAGSFCSIPASFTYRLGNWAWSMDYGELCQVIEAQTLWGETTCRVWLRGRNSVVHIPASRLKSLESAGTGSPDDIAYVAAARVADALTQDHRQGGTGFLLAPIKSSVIPLPHQIQGRNFSEKLPLIRIFLEGTGHE